MERENVTGYRIPRNLTPAEKRSTVTQYVSGSCCCFTKSVKPANADIPRLVKL